MYNVACVATSKASTLQAHPRTLLVANAPIVWIYSNPEETKCAFSSSQTTPPVDPPTSLEQLFRLWGLDASLRRYHGRSLGIEHLYPWQARCLALPGVAAGDRDLLYSAPTSGGKTMVAELLLLLRVVGRPLACYSDGEDGGGGEAARAESGRVTPLQQKGLFRRWELGCRRCLVTKRGFGVSSHNKYSSTTNRWRRDVLYNRFACVRGVPSVWLCNRVFPIMSSSIYNR